VLDGETGFLFDLQTPNALMNTLKQLTNDRDLCSRLGARARSHVAKSFSWCNVAQAYLALFSPGLT
jgi:glycosyltransferase involved in cell wall biosynthesis